jgi:hypothetical protein
MFAVLQALPYLAAQEVGDHPGCIKSVQSVCPSIAFIEPPWHVIKQWIPDDAISFHCQDIHISNESRWKPRQLPLGDDRILVLDAD